MLWHVNHVQWAHLANTPYRLRNCKSTVTTQSVRQLGSTFLLLLLPGNKMETFDKARGLGWVRASRLLV